MSVTPATSGRSPEGRGVSGTPDPASVRTATPAPEIDAVAAASRAAVRTRLLVRTVPGAGEGFGLAMASAVGIRWPSRDTRMTASAPSRAGTGAREVTTAQHHHEGDTRGSGRAATRERDGAAASRAATDSDVGSKAVRDLATGAARTGRAAAAEPAETAGTASRAADARPPVTGSPGAAALPEDVLWQAVQSLVSGTSAEAALDGAAPGLAHTLAVGPMSARGAGSATVVDLARAAATASSAPELPTRRQRAGDHLTLHFGGDGDPAGTVRLALRGDALRATIVALTAADADRLARDLDSLRRALRAQGFTDTRIAVQAPRALPTAASTAPAHDQTPRDPRRSREEADARRALSDLYTSAPAQEVSR